MSDTPTHAELRPFILFELARRETPAGDPIVESGCTAGACTGNDVLDGQCRTTKGGRILKVRLSHGQPQTQVTLRLDGDPTTDVQLSVKRNGKASMEFEQLSAGPHTVEVLECGTRVTFVCR